MSAACPEAVLPAATARSWPRLGTAALPLLLVLGLVTLCPGSELAHGDDDDAALALLQRAMVAASGASYRGTQMDATWTPAGMTTRMIDVEQVAGGLRRSTVHTPGNSTTSVTSRSVAGGVAADSLTLLAGAYALALAGRSTVVGRPVSEVVALRRGKVAARLWLDDASGLLLRQEVWDRQGRLTRMVGFVELDHLVAGGGAEPTTATSGGKDPQAVARRLESPCPATLPGGYRLVDARAVTVTAGPGGASTATHLTYSDGLSALSVFVQPGRLPSGGPAGMTSDEWHRQRVYLGAGWPLRVVWDGGGHVFTAISDAPVDELVDVVGALPGGQSGDGVLGWLAMIMRTAGVPVPGR